MAGAARSVRALGSMRRISTLPGSSARSGEPAARQRHLSARHLSSTTPDRYAGRPSKPSFGGELWVTSSLSSSKTLRWTFQSPYDGRPAVRLSPSGRGACHRAGRPRGLFRKRGYYSARSVGALHRKIFLGFEVTRFENSEARTGKTRQMIARRIRPTAAESSLASSFLAMLPAHAGKLSGAAGEIIAEQALDLVAVSFAKTLEGERPRVSSARSLALLNLRAAVEARLRDPTLDSEIVAAAAGVSVRYANAVLAQEGTSIARLIQERRLARCRRALEDPSQNHRTISEIAYGWGFSDMTHFGRRFKTAFGLSPRDYRSAAVNCRDSQVSAR